MSEREKSASELQIEEKRERLDAMSDFAIQLTKKRILELKDKSKEEIDHLLKAEGIPINAFLHSYITLNVSKVNTAVSMKTAHSYFDHLSKSLNPEFVVFNPEGPQYAPIHFRLSDLWLDQLIKQVRAKPKTETVKFR